jgi:hypothetical protein
MPSEGEGMEVRKKTVPTAPSEVEVPEAENAPAEDFFLLSFNKMSMLVFLL